MENQWTLVIEIKNDKEELDKITEEIMEEIIKLSKEK